MTQLVLPRLQHPGCDLLAAPLRLGFVPAVVWARVLSCRLAVGEDLVLPIEVHEREPNGKSLPADANYFQYATVAQLFHHETRFKQLRRLASIRLHALNIVRLRCPKGAHQRVELPAELLGHCDGSGVLLRCQNPPRRALVEVLWLRFCAGRLGINVRKIGGNVTGAFQIRLPDIQRVPQENILRPG